MKIKFSDLILMFQKEVGDKILGKFTHAITEDCQLLANYKLKIINKFFVSANCFS